MSIIIISYLYAAIEALVSSTGCRPIHNYAVAQKPRVRGGAKHLTFANQVSNCRCVNCMPVS